MPTSSNSQTSGHLLNVKELSEYLGVSVSSVRRLIRDQQVPVVRVRGTIRFNPAAVESVLTSADGTNDQ